MISWEFVKEHHMKPDLLYWTWAPIWQAWIMTEVELRVAIQSVADIPRYRINKLIDSAVNWYRRTHAINTEFVALNDATRVHFPW